MIDVEGQTEKTSGKEGLVAENLSELQFLSDLWLGTPEKKNLTFLRIYRLLSIVVVVIQFMVLGSVIYDNILLPPCKDLSFQIVTARLFVVFYLAGNIADCVSKDVLGYFSMMRMGIADFEADSYDSTEGQVVYLLFLIAQGFYIAFGLPVLVFGLMRMQEDKFTLLEMIVFLLLGIYEWTLLVLVLIASVAVVLVQTDAVSILFNFLGVLVIMQLDDILFKLVHFKVKKLEKLKASEFSLASAKISLAGFVAVVTFIYSFIAKT